MATASPSKRRRVADQAAATAPLTTGHNALLPPPGVTPHTLILGTHPSVASLAHAEYYGHRMNAFWWIAGASLGFTRGRHLAPANIAPHLPSGHAMLPYHHQCAALTAKGFVVWDVLGSCRRRGSLDASIAEKDRAPNDIVGFLAKHPTIQRICFSSGSTTAKLFLQHNRSWLASTTRQLELADNPQTVRVFGKQKWAMKGHSDSEVATDADGLAPLVLCVMLSVSPAFANPAHGGTFPDKLAQWKADCYEPGIQLHKKLQKSV